MESGAYFLLRDTSDDDVYGGGGDIRTGRRGVKRWLVDFSELRLFLICLSIY